MFARVWFLLCSHIFVLFDILLVSGRRRRPPVTINPRVLCFPAINGIICGFWAVVWAGRQKSPPFTRQMNWPSIHRRLNCLCRLLFGRRQGNLKGKKANFDMLAGWGKFHFHCICILERRQYLWNQRSYFVFRFQLWVQFYQKNRQATRKVALNHWKWNLPS